MVRVEGTELGGVERQRSSYVLQVGSHLNFEGHPHVVPAVALWLKCSHVDYVPGGKSGNSTKRGPKKLRHWGVNLAFMSKARSLVLIFSWLLFKLHE